MPRIDGIHYEHELTAPELENIRANLVGHVQFLLGEISTVNAMLDAINPPEIIGEDNGTLTPNPQI